MLLGRSRRGRRYFGDSLRTWQLSDFFHGQDIWVRDGVRLVAGCRIETRPAGGRDYYRLPQRRFVWLERGGRLSVRLVSLPHEP